MFRCVEKPFWCVENPKTPPKSTYQIEGVGGDHTYGIFNQPSYLESNSNP
jgi:hypothetical protein